MGMDATVTRVERPFTLLPLVPEGQTSTEWLARIKATLATRNRKGN